MVFFVGFPDKFSKRRPQKVHTLFFEIFLDFREKLKKNVHSFSFKFLAEFKKKQCVYFLWSPLGEFIWESNKKNHIQFEKLFKK